MDGYLKSNLDLIKGKMGEDWDCVFTIDGREGSGKSVLAMQIVEYLCHDLGGSLKIENVVFTPFEFLDAIKRAKKFEGIIYDEAFTGLDSSGSYQFVNRTLIKAIAEIRQKNLFVCIVMPTYFDLMKYVALWRSRFLIHTYTPDNWQRGYFTFFNDAKKKDLFLKGKKFYEYGVVKANFYGRFSGAYVISEKEYRQKKLDSLTTKRILSEEAIEANLLKKVLEKKVFGLPETVPANVKMLILDMSERTYYRHLERYRQSLSLENKENDDFGDDGEEPAVP